MSTVLAFIPLTGLIVTWIVLYVRAGFPAVDADWREFLLPNLGWFGLMGLKFMFWPITLVVWLATGRGPSPWTAVTERDGREVRDIVHVAPWPWAR